jgi:streptogramin lyase
LVVSPDGSVWFVEMRSGAPAEFVRGTASGQMAEFPVPAQFAAANLTLASSSSRGLWFLDERHVGHITPTGEVRVYHVVSAENESVEAVSPTTIRLSLAAVATAAPDDSLWLSDDSVLTGSCAIERVTPGGRVSTYACTTDMNVNSIAVGQDATAWFALEPTANAGPSAEIGRIAPDGSVASFGRSVHLVTPGGLVVAPDHTAWFNDGLSGNYIGRITTTGRITKYPVLDGAGNLRVAPDGAVWFTIGQSTGAAREIGRIGPDGQVNAYRIPIAGGVADLQPGPANALWVLGHDGTIGRITGGHWFFGV